MQITDVLIKNISVSVHYYMYGVFRAYRIDFAWKLALIHFVKPQNIREGKSLKIVKDN